MERQETTRVILIVNFNEPESIFCLDFLTIVVDQCLQSKNIFHKKKHVELQIFILPISKNLYGCDCLQNIYAFIFK